MVPFHFGTPFWAQKKIYRRSWAPPGHLLCPQTRSRDPLGTSQKSFKAENKNLKISKGFTSKVEPWRTFADPGPSKRAPLGPDQLSRGPPGRPLGRQTHLPGPSRAPPGNPQGPISKKHVVFLKIAETTIYVRFGAFRGKRPPLQNRVFRPLEAPWSPPEAEPFPSRPPPSPPKPTLELPGPPQILPRAPRSPQGPHKIHKDGLIKTLEICVFDP